MSRLNRWTLSTLAVLTLLAPGSVRAQSSHGSDLSVGVRFGTLGFGGEVSKLVTSHLGLRVGANTYSHTWAGETHSGVQYDVSVKLKAVTALVDLYPSARGSFHLTGGLITRPAEVTAVGKPTGGTYKFNGTEYNAADVGDLSGEGKWPGSAAYAGLGWGTPAASHGALKFVFDLGAAFTKPTISLNASKASTNPELAADVAAQQAKTQSDVNKYLKVYPVISLGLVYRF